MSDERPAAKVSVSKAFYVHCDDCDFESFEFFKDDVKRVVKSHNCEKYLKRRVYNGRTKIAERFNVSVTRV